MNNLIETDETGYQYPGPIYKIICPNWDGFFCMFYEGKALGVYSVFVTEVLPYEL